MTIKELVKILKSCPNQNAVIRVSSDPEGNNIQDIANVGADNMQWNSVSIWPK